MIQVLLCAFALIRHYDACAAAAASDGDTSASENTCDEGSTSTCNASGNSGVVASSYQQDKCTLYLAKSTIPNAGLGIFTGIPLNEGDHVGYGDPSIPVVDLDFHNQGSRRKKDYHWMLTEYDWKADEVGPQMEMEGDSVSAFVTGMGSMPNCHFRLKNVAETFSLYDTPGVKRAGGLDPGIGAFTGYHNRSTYTLEPLGEGSELFVDYGTEWFLTREHYMGLIPLKKSYKVATSFMEKYDNLLKEYSSEEDVSENEAQAHQRAAIKEAKSDLWDFIIDFPHKSRPLSALPKTISLAERALEVGIKQIELEQSIRPLEYLEMHGKCLDNLRPGNSTIPQAGRGAFATRFLPKGSLVAPAPLLHIADRFALDIFSSRKHSKTGREVRNLSKKIGKQLLLNYCFGHHSSTLLLCPYGPGTSFINHDSKSPNAKIIWSQDPLYHNSSWFDQQVNLFLENEWSPGVAFEYVPLRDIEEGEEVTIDYGKEWEEAWNEHVANWVAPKGSKNYVSPADLNADQVSPLRTYEEDPDMYGVGVVGWCYLAKSSVVSKSKKWMESDLEDGHEYEIMQIIDRKQAEDDPGSYVYTLGLYTGKKSKKDPYVVKGVPRKAITFHMNLYSSNTFIKGVFRHEMMVPDDMFPDAWRNYNA